MAVAEVVDPSEVDEEAEFIHHAEVSDTGSLTAFPRAHEVLALPRVAVVTSCDHSLTLARMAGAGLERPSSAPIPPNASCSRTPRRASPPDARPG